MTAVHLPYAAEQDDDVWSAQARLSSSGADGSDARAGILRKPVDDASRPGGEAY